MKRALAVLVGSMALAAVLSFPTAVAANERGVAILPPLESPDGPPHHKGTFVPYYGSPLTPISTRWRPVAYVPYYRGYCRPFVHYAHAPYGWDGGGLPPFGAELSPGIHTFGPFTGARATRPNSCTWAATAPISPPCPVPRTSSTRSAAPV